jgi:tetratricopeptide (TPR) repeat protein
MPYKPMALAVSILALAGCSTSIQLAVKRPPTLNTAGINRIAIMPFEAQDASNEMARYAYAVSLSNIQAMNHFTLVDYTEIERLRRGNQSIESVADATFVGRMTRTASGSEEKPYEWKDKEGNIHSGITYTTSVEVDFNYSLIRARDGSLIGPVSKRGRQSASSNEDYPSASDLMRKTIDSQLRSVGRDLAPYTSIESRTFVVDKTPNNELKAEMKSALALVKAGNYKQALDAYLRIYEQYKSVAAAENASILHESFGDVLAAANLMKQAYNETGNPKAMVVLDRLNHIIKDQETLATEYSDKKSQAERTSASASEEIRRFLPQGAKVLIYNTTPENEKAIVVLDNIIADFINAGISVVDRDQLSAALIQEEHLTQMSGAVSDDDIVRIGNATGANTIVMLGVEGSGALRRLRVKVLDVEKRVPIMQSDASGKWQL